MTARRVELARPIYCPRCGAPATVELVRGGCVEEQQAEHLATVPGELIEIDDEDDDEATGEEATGEEATGAGPQGVARCDQRTLFGGVCGWSRWVWRDECVPVVEEGPGVELVEEARACGWCREPIERGIYCSTRCRVAAFRERRRNQTAADLSVTSSSEAPPETLREVAALYVRDDGIYPTLPGVDPWGVGRDASRYQGAAPVVAHPPCGPWGKYRHTCIGQRADLAVRAVAQVRRAGGVLEHPAGSHLWVACELPPPGGARDRFGGWTMLIRQSWWGHRAPKATWLYIVGRLDVPPMPPPCPDPGGRIENMSKAQREATPPELARWLVELARGCRAGIYRKRGYPPRVAPPDEPTPGP